MMPFGNELDVVTVKGKNIRDQLEISVKDWSSKGESGRFLQMSGKLIYYIPTINTADFTDFDIILSNPPRQISLLTKSSSDCKSVCIHTRNVVILICNE